MHKDCFETWQESLLNILTSSREAQVSHLILTLHGILSYHITEESEELVREAEGPTLVEAGRGNNLLKSIEKDYRFELKKKLRS